MASTPFAEFARTADAVAATRSKLAKRDLLAAYLRGLPDEDLPVAATFFAGRPLPGADDRLGLGWVQQSQALAAASGADAEALNAAYLRHSDFGDAAADLLEVIEPALPFIDYFMPGIDEARMICGLHDRHDVIRFFLDRGVGKTVFKMGAEGSSIAWRGGRKARATL